MVVRQTIVKLIRYLENFGYIFSSEIDAFLSENLGSFIILEESEKKLELLDYETNKKYVATLTENQFFMKSTTQFEKENSYFVVADTGSITIRSIRDGILQVDDIMMNEDKTIRQIRTSIYDKNATSYLLSNHINSSIINLQLDLNSVFPDIFQYTTNNIYSSLKTIIFRKKNVWERKDIKYDYELNNIVAFHYKTLYQSGLLEEVKEDGKDKSKELLKKGLN